MRLRDQHPSAATDLDALDGQFKRDTGLRAYIAIDGRAAGIVEYADRVREDSRLVIASLQALGVRRLLLLSGDHAHTVRAIAAEVGIADARANMLPSQRQR